LPSANTSHLLTHCWIKDWHASLAPEAANHNFHVVKSHKTSTMPQEIWEKGVRQDQNYSLKLG